MAFTGADGVTYQVTPDYVAQASTDSLSTAELVQAQLQNLKTYVMGLESEWRGVAHQQFVVLMQEYDASSRMLHQALTDIGTGLHSTAANYQDSEQSNYTNVAGIQVPTTNLR